MWIISNRNIDIRHVILLFVLGVSFLNSVRLSRPPMPLPEGSHLSQQPTWPSQDSLFVPHSSTYTRLDVKTILPLPPEIHPTTAVHNRDINDQTLSNISEDNSSECPAARRPGTESHYSNVNEEEPPEIHPTTADHNRGIGDQTFSNISEDNCNECPAARRPGTESYYSNVTEQ